MSAKWKMSRFRKSQFCKPMKKNLLPNSLALRVRFYFFIGMLIFLTGLPGFVSAQESETETLDPIDTYLNYTALSTSDDSVVLSARLYIRRGRIPIDLQNAPISFGVVSGDQTLALGSAHTDSTGTARISIPFTGLLPQDEEGMITYTADFPGTSRFLGSSETFSSQPASLNVSFYEEDSVKYIRVTGTRFVSDGEPEPLAEETVYVFVPSLFRPLPIGEIYLDETGTGTLEFPSGLIGDAEGNLMVIARIDEHDRYGYVKGEALSSWAIPKHLLSQDKPVRELWTPVAPLWMIITLLIMLAGVWAHYIYAIIQLVRIRLSSKKEVQEE